MNYPVWQLDFFGGGLLIACIAVFHVYIAHFAVGGGLFLVLAEIKGLREGDAGILAFVKKHTLFFLLLSMVAGGLTGVAIWFTIALLNPSATSSLIHTFVFGWAIEWVFFVGEIVALFIYYYTFGKMDNRNHLIIGWIYFGCAWMSLFVINGIIDYMLTPGAWIETRSFWDGFFNPTFWPALFFRTFFALMIAGLFGLVTATSIKDGALRIKMVRFCALWLLAPFSLFLASAWWYVSALSPDLRELVFERMPELTGYIQVFSACSVLLIAGGLIVAVKLPQKASRILTVLMLVIGLIYMGAFEFVREGGRKPYIIRDYMYSTSILKEDQNRVTEKGVLQSARWVEHRRITNDNRAEAGREIFNLLCLPCHSIGGPINDIHKVTSSYDYFGMTAMLDGLASFSPYMVPFAGTDKEKQALALFLTKTLGGKSPDVKAAEIKPREVEIPSFDMNASEYVLLAWSDMGMNMSSSGNDLIDLPVEGVTIRAQLVRRGETPEIVTDGISLGYEIDTSGAGGNLTAGDGFFVGKRIRLSPWSVGKDFQPYPLLTVFARDAAGRELARTRVVAPVSPEIGCSSCHGGRPESGPVVMTNSTAENILAAHDKRSHTTLLAQAGKGGKVRCRECHADVLSNDKGDPNLLNLSASLHGFHANYLVDKGADACTVCHPGADTDSTRFFRSMHYELAFDCTMCHGDLAEHALSLLKKEFDNGKKQADRLMLHLKPVNFDNVDEIVPRGPWENLPDCLNCHEDFQAPESMEAFNRWTKDKDFLFRNRREMSEQIFCAACHNSPHAVYRATNPYGKNRDVIQPLQYQGNPLPIGSNFNCKVCHTIDMEDEMHHPNMLREFRN